jgi:hypothetical protein
VTDLIKCRAGANFSGISGGDANALRWDRAGYTLMVEMIDKQMTEAKYLAKTDSTEYWDEMPQPDKIQSMTEYLRDVRTAQIFRLLKNEKN